MTLEPGRKLSSTAGARYKRLVTYGISSLQMNVLTHASSSNDPLQRGLTYQPWDHGTGI
jgi:hypothetical protein